MPTLKLGELNVPYIVRTSDKCKNATIRIKRDLTLEVVIPSGKKIDAKELIKKESNWIEKKYSELSRTKKTIDKNRILYRGKYYPIEKNSSTGKLGEVELTDQKIIVHINKDDDPIGLLHNWMKSETSSFVKNKIDELSKRFDIEVNNIYIRSINKWGLCSRKGDLTFNWHLIALPDELSEYVILHEFAHLLEFNHSKRFKTELSKMCPDYKERESRLDSYFSV